MSNQAPKGTPVPPDRFRDALALLPSGVTVITSHHAGRAHGFTASSFTSVSLEPPLVLVCASRRLDVLSAIEASGGFAVNVLGADQVALGRRFAGLVEGVTDRFAGVRFRMSPSGHPWLDGCLAHLDCQLWRRYDGGDHAIIVGQVTAVQREVARPPLVYFDRTWGRAVPLSTASPPESIDAGTALDPGALPALLGALEPRLEDGEFVFVTIRPGAVIPGTSIGTFREEEALTAILPREDAAREGIRYDGIFRRITLTVPSDLLAVGLLAAVTGRLAAANIPANVVSAFHHDHVFVPEDRAREALEQLRALQAEWRAAPMP